MAAMNTIKGATPVNPPTQAHGARTRTSIVAMTTSAALGEPTPVEADPPGETYCAVAMIRFSGRFR